jgi:hypothetical protein
MRNILEWFSARTPRAHRSRPIRNKVRQVRSRPMFESLEERAMLAAGVTPVFAVTNDWGSGYQAQVTLNNQQTTSVANWKLEFDMPSNITSLWDGQISSHTGNHYVIVGANWNKDLAAGGSLSFGFVASPGGKPVAPTNYLLNGAPIGGTTPPPPPPTPSLSISDVSVTEGNSGATSALFTVNLSAAASGPVTVKYATANGTAAAGSDYTAASGTLTFAAGERSKTINVAVLGDTSFEADETFALTLSNPTGATIARGTGTGAIKNDDTAPATGNFVFTVTSDWGSGFTGQLTVKNSTASAITNWQLAFEFPANITQIWDATIVSRTGSHYVLKNAGYNSVIPAGGTLAFGFNGSPGNTTVLPTNYVLSSGSGSTGGGTGGNPGGGNHTPVAVTDLNYTSPGAPVTINVLANDTDADGDALSVSSITQPTNGAAVLNSDYTVKYTPRAGFTGTDSFTYLLKDAQGATVAGAVSVTVAKVSAWPAHVFAPYVDMTLYPTYDLVSAAQTQGLRYFSLGFVVADSTGAPAWGGFSEYKLGTTYDAQMKSQIAGLRALGGDVVVSFGGASNLELAQKITNVAALQAAYQSVIDAYGLTHVDFDIEGAAAADKVSVDRRNQAIAGLQSAAAAAGRVLDVSYTLPVLPSGLVADGLYIVQSAIRYGVNVSVYNVMAMDYGASAAPNPAGQMGTYAINAATSLFNQLKSAYGATKTDAQLWAMVGVTPMIGMNDDTSEIFDQTAARQLVAFAQQKGLGRLAFWDLNRDQQNAAGKLTYVDLKSSSVLQSPFEFSQIFKPFTS